LILDRPGDQKSPPVGLAYGGPLGRDDKTGNPLSGQSAKENRKAEIKAIIASYGKEPNSAVESFLLVDWSGDVIIVSLGTDL
jgi:hypothetical protein